MEPRYKTRVNFEQWLRAAQRDLAALAGYLNGGRLEYGIRSMFAIDLAASEVRSLVPSARTVPAIIKTAPVVYTSAPCPWGSQ